MKKILMLANSTTSLFRFRKEMITALIGDGWQVFASSPDDGFADEIKSLGAVLIDTPVDRHGTNPLGDYLLLRRYRAMMREIKPDIVLAYTIKPNIYGNLVAAAFKIPVISMVTGLGNVFLRNGIVSAVAKNLYRLAFRHTARVLFLNNEDMKTMKSARILSGESVLLRGGEGVSLDNFKLLPYPDGGAVSFLYVGRIMRAKGIVELIEAARRLESDYPGMARVTLIGSHEGDITGEVEQAEREGIIRYAGFQKDVGLFVRDAHCVVLPSYQEGLSVALMEAAAMGRPIIATDISGCREVVDDGVNGFLCKPQDTDSLYKSMARFLKLQPEQKTGMGLASRKKAEAEFDRRIAVQDVLKLIAKILGR